MIFIFMLSIYGMGFYYNEMYRIGSSIFPSDLALIGMIFYLWIRNQVLRIPKNMMYAFFIVLFELAVGLAAGNYIGNILRDVKIAIYFLGVYFILNTFCQNRDDVEKLFKSYFIIVGLSIVANFYDFITHGLTNIDQGEILRTFSIGMGWGCVIPIFLLVNTYSEMIKKQYGIIVYYGLNVLSLVCIALSSTRTLWISVAVAFFIKKVLIDHLRFTLNGMVSAFFSVGILVAVCMFLYKSNNLIFMSIYNKFTEISSAFADEDSTLLYRLQDITSAFYKFDSPRIVWGYGYGDTRLPYGYRIWETSEEVNCENSYFYYVWKYGIIIAIILFTTVINKLKRLWMSGSKGVRVWVVYMTVFMIVGSMSGNLNSNYSIALYALHFTIANHMDVGLKLFHLEI